MKSSARKATKSCLLNECDYRSFFKPSGLYRRNQSQPAGPGTIYRAVASTNPWQMIIVSIPGCSPRVFRILRCDGERMSRPRRCSPNCGFKLHQSRTILSSSALRASPRHRFFAVLCTDAQFRIICGAFFITFDLENKTYQEQTHTGAGGRRVGKLV